MKLPIYRRELAWRERGLDALIGALGVLGLAPLQIWPATIAAFALLFVRLSAYPRSEPWRGTATAFWAGIGYFAAGMFWIASAFVERGPEYIPLIVPLVFGLFVLLSIFWAWAGRAFVMMQPRPLLGPVVFASVFFIAEFIRGHLFGGFPWNLPGYAWEAGTAMSQFASVVGVYGQSYLLMLVGGGLGAAWLARGSVARTGLHGGLAVAVLAGLFAYGTARIPKMDNTSEQRLAYADTRLRLVHLPFRQREMMDRATANRITNGYFRETFSAPLDNVTHIVWPEGAVRGFAADNYEFLSVIPTAFAGQDDVRLPTFLFSSIREERPGAGEVDWFNSAVAVSYADGFPAVAGYADKRRLVPFAEIVPLEPLLSAIGFEAIAASFTPAPDKSNRTFPGLPEASVQICYEVLFPGLTEGRPAFILNQSNDAWFGRTTGPAQHAATARMRALEEGVPLVRSAANGWSGTVDAWGRWVVRMDPDETGIRDVDIPAQTIDTPFSRLTHVILLLISLSACLCSIVAGRALTRGVGELADGRSFGAGRLQD